jgi:ABC-type sugar transport system ATPase subunit
LASLELIALSKSFGRVEAVRNVSLSVADGELVVFVGPSGCGKSTLLRMIAGLEAIDGGRLLIGGREMNAVAAADRGIAMVFQSYALYPHMSVAENMGFALKMVGTAPAEIGRKVEAVAATLQLGDLLQRKPRELSGGQRQRVAIGRAIVREPDVFLFDEPLSNLDADLRAQMRVEIARLHQRLGTTMVYVTHDQVEAMTLADRIVILNRGRVEQEGRPLDLYERPTNRFVAGFLGQPKMNFLPVTAHRGTTGHDLRLSPGGPLILSRALPPGFAAEEVAELGIRPNAIAPADAGGPAAEVVLVEHLGSSTLLHVRLEGLADLLRIECPGKASAASGATIRLRIDPAGTHVFDRQGRTIG